MPFAYEFVGLKFGPRVQDLVPQVIPPEVISGERHVPYSNITVLDLGGRGPRRFKSSIRVASIDRVAFEDLVGSTGTLYVATIPWPQSTLMKLDNHTMTPLGQHTDTDFVLDGQWHFYDAEWTIGGTTA